LQFFSENITKEAWKLLKLRRFHNFEQIWPSFISNFDRILPTLTFNFKQIFSILTNFYQRFELLWGCYTPHPTPSVATSLEGERSSRRRVFAR
jgi:hypothetical protein